MSGNKNTRAASALLCHKIIDQGQSLDRALADFFTNNELSGSDKGFIQELVYGVCRWKGLLDQIASQLLQKPLRKKEQLVHQLLLVGLYQLHFLNTADHAAVGETVKASKQLGKTWATKLINGCLRNYQRKQDSINQFLAANTTAASTHPKWISEVLTQAWPEHAEQILAANDQHAPMCLRVNQRQHSRDQYLSILIDSNIDAEKDPNSDVGIVLKKPVAVTKLPGFDQGHVSVQDTAAQLACSILDAKAGHSVLDACAAPGGKAAHLQEAADNQLTLHALEVSEARTESLQQTFSRLQLQAEIFNADATKLSSWPHLESYDRIIIDAPCSGLGVIRRHPDIKHHRRETDIPNLVELQHDILSSLWSLLKPSGQLLYMTCSVLPEENHQQIERFIANTKDAYCLEFNHPNAIDLEYGKQTLPGVHGMDGFYYALLGKN